MIIGPLVRLLWPLTFARFILLLVIGHPLVEGKLRYIPGGIFFVVLSFAPGLAVFIPVSAAPAAFSGTAVTRSAIPGTRAAPAFPA
ncbi:hypothetical protein FACS1894106_3460 [Spirochaetia bacterium]|nr:hypothetical protein FACS1894106_3460 [Spirochaetia bacterium]